MKLQNDVTAWVDALESEQTVELHPEVLRAVLAMNPALREGRTTGRVRAELLAASAPPAPKPYSEGKFQGVFGDLLASIQRDWAGYQRELSAKRAALDAEEKRTAAALTKRIVDFLVKTEPGALSEVTRGVLREHGATLRNLGVDLAGIARSVRKLSDSFRINR